MRTKTLIFAFLITASSAVSAEQSALDSLGKKAAEDAVKSAVPEEVTQGMKSGGKATKETVTKSKSVKETAENPSSPEETKPGTKATEETVTKSKSVKETVEKPSLKSMKDTAKKKAVDSTLDMMR